MEWVVSDGMTKVKEGVDILRIDADVERRNLGSLQGNEEESKVKVTKCDIKSGNECMDRILVERQMRKKDLAKGREVYRAFINSGKAYERVDKDAMGLVSRLYRAVGRLLEDY